jgi:hypothetical protein
MKLSPLVRSVGDGLAFEASLRYAAATGFCRSFGVAEEPAAVRRRRALILGHLVTALARDGHDAAAMTAVLRAGPAAVAEWVRTSVLDDEAAEALNAFLASRDAAAACRRWAEVVGEVLADPYLTILALAETARHKLARRGRCDTV